MLINQCFSSTFIPHHNLSGFFFLNEILKLYTIFGRQKKICKHLNRLGRSATVTLFFSSFSIFIEKASIPRSSFFFEHLNIKRGEEDTIHFSKHYQSSDELIFLS